MKKESNETKFMEFVEKVCRETDFYFCDDEYFEFVVGNSVFHLDADDVFQTEDGFDLEADEDGDWRFVLRSQSCDDPWSDEVNIYFNPDTESIEDFVHKAYSTAREQVSTYIKKELKDALKDSGYHLREFGDFKRHIDKNYLIEDVNGYVHYKFNVRWYNNFEAYTNDDDSVFLAQYEWPDEDNIDALVEEVLGDVKY